MKAGAELRKALSGWECSAGLCGLSNHFCFQNRNSSRGNPPDSTSLLSTEQGVADDRPKAYSKVFAEQRSLESKPDKLLGQRH